MTTIYHNDTATTAADLITNNADDPQVVRAVLDLVEGKSTTVEMGGGGAPRSILSLYPSPPMMHPYSDLLKGLSTELMTVASADRPYSVKINVQNEGRAGHMLRFDRDVRGDRVAFVTDWDGCYKVGLYDSWDHYQGAGVLPGIEVPAGADFEFGQHDDACKLASAWVSHDDNTVDVMTKGQRFVYEIEAVMTCNVTVRIEGPLTEKEARDAVEEHLSGYGSGSSAEFETQYIHEDGGIEAEVIDVEVWQGVQDMDTISAEEG